MSDITIYHNPRCSKSRETLQLLQSKNITPHIVLYLETPPNADTIRELLNQLGFNSARQLMRTKESDYQELCLADEKLSEEQLIMALTQHPKLIERPIVVSRGKARIGRPPEQVLEII